MPNLTRRRTILSVALAALLVLGPAAAGAQEDPTNPDPISVYVPIVDRTVTVFPEPPEDEADTTIGVRAGDHDIHVEHYADDEDDPTSGVFTAGCEVAEHGDPVTYCETSN